MANKKQLQKEINNKILNTIEEYNNNGKKTIAIFCDAYYPAVDGVIKVFENQAMLLSKNNNVIVCVPKHKNKLDDNRPYLVLGCNSISVSKIGYDYGFPNFDDFFNKALKKARIDIIHLHSPFALGSFAVNLAKKKKIPVIGTFHSEYRKDFYQATKNKSITKLLLNIIMNVYNRCDLVTTMNPYAESLIKDYGYKGKIKLIPNSTGFVVHQNIDKEIMDLKTKYNINNQIIFCFIGRLIVQKQILFIVDVLKVLKDKGLNFKMFFIGKGVDYNKLKKKIDENNLNENIIFTGSINDEKIKSAILTISDLFIFPSTYDTDGIVKIEAACAKLPTICVENTGVSSTITDNINGFVSKLDIETFSNRIINLLNDKENLKKVGEKAFKDLYISWNEIVKILELTYEDVINNYNSKNKKL